MHQEVLYGEDDMNRSMQEKWPWLEGSREMRLQLLDILSDADLAFSPVKSCCAADILLSLA